MVIIGPLAEIATDNVGHWPSATVTARSHYVKRNLIIKQVINLLASDMQSISTVTNRQADKILQ